MSLRDRLANGWAWRSGSCWPVYPCRAAGARAGEPTGWRTPLDPELAERGRTRSARGVSEAGVVGGGVRSGRSDSGRGRFPIRRRSRSRMRLDSGSIMGCTRPLPQ